MPVGIAIGRGTQFAISMAQEALGRAELMGPTPGLSEPQDAIARSRQQVTNGGGTLAGSLHGVVTPFESARAEAEENILSATGYAEKMYIQNVDKPDQIVAAQFNPEKLKEAIGVDWQKFQIPGLSHQKLQYGSAKNLEYRFELMFNAAAGSALWAVDGATGDVAQSQVAKNLASRDQLHAWTLRRREETLRAIGDTQRLLFVWPNFIMLTCVLVSAEFEYTAFRKDGIPTTFKADLMLEEIRDVILYAEDVLLTGRVNV